MVDETSTGTFDTVTASNKVTNPSAGDDIVVQEVERTAMLTSLTYSADNPATGVVELRLQDGTGATEAYRVGVDTAKASETVTGTKDDPVVEVPAGTEVAVTSDDGTAGDESASIVLQERNL